MVTQGIHDPGSSIGTDPRNGEQIPNPELRKVTKACDASGEHLGPCPPDSRQRAQDLDRFRG